MAQKFERRVSSTESIISFTSTFDRAKKIKDTYAAED